MDLPPSHKGINQGLSPPKLRAKIFVLCLLSLKVEYLFSVWYAWLCPCKLLQNEHIFALYLPYLVPSLGPVQTMRVV